MIVDDLRLGAAADGQCELSARVRPQGRREFRLWFRFPEAFAPAGVDGSPFLAAVLVSAMRWQQDLTIDAPVSPRLLGNVETLSSVYQSFFPQLRRPVSVSAPAQAPPVPTPLTGSFFSRGVDSWFAVLTALEDEPHDPPLTHLVFCPGFLPDTWSSELVRAQTDATRRAAEAAGCRFVVVDTNQRRDLQRAGHRLAGMALALGFQRMLIPSGGMRGELRPRNTHPDIDPRYSTERTEIVHYGDASRMQKIARIARSDEALRLVQVCRDDEASVVGNCGRCEKCLRTMLQLRAAGALERAPGFADTVDPMRLAGIQRHIPHPRQWVDIVHSLGEEPEDRRLAAAVRLVTARAMLRDAREQLGRASRDPELAVLDPGLPAAFDDVRRITRFVYRAFDVTTPGGLRRLRRMRRLLELGFERPEMVLGRVRPGRRGTPETHGD